MFDFLNTNPFPNVFFRQRINKKREVFVLGNYKFYAIQHTDLIDGTDLPAGRQVHTDNSATQKLDYVQ
jgi:hypothetical protein